MILINDNIMISNIYKSNLYNSIILENPTDINQITPIRFD